MCQDSYRCYQELPQPVHVDDKNGLYVFSSGACVSAEVKQEKKTESNKAATKKRDTIQTSHQKAIEYKKQGDIAFSLMVKAQSSGKQLNLREIMNYVLTPVPYSIGTSDNFFTKTDRAKGLHYLLI